jgi:hypothetical protein
LYNRTFEGSTDSTAEGMACLTSPAVSTHSPATQLVYVSGFEAGFNWMVSVDLNLTYSELTVGKLTATVSCRHDVVTILELATSSYVGSPDHANFVMIR